MKTVGVFLVAAIVAITSAEVKQPVPNQLYLEEAVDVAELYAQINIYEVQLVPLQNGLFSLLTQVQLQNHEMHGVYFNTENYLTNLANQNVTARACVAKHGNVPVTGGYTNRTLGIFQQVQNNQQFLTQFNMTAYLNYARVQVFDMVSTIENCYSEYVIDQNISELQDCVGNAYKLSSIAVAETLNMLNRPLAQMNQEIKDGNTAIAAVIKDFHTDTDNVLNEVNECIRS